MACGRYPCRLIQDPDSRFAARGEDDHELNGGRNAANHNRLTLPAFNVHQNFDNVLMNGERDGQGNGTESEIY